LQVQLGNFCFTGFYFVGCLNKLFFYFRDIKIGLLNLQVDFVLLDLKLVDFIGERVFL